MIMLGLLLIPRLGLDGAAIAYATSLALRNIGMFTLARILVRPGAVTAR
jgi:O-antigen/teichoic acid export membrane protein